MYNSLSCKFPKFFASPSFAGRKRVVALIFVNFSGGSDIGFAVSSRNGARDKT